MENKLIPMTDFVLSILNNTSPNNFVKGVESIRAYAEFLKQPLALWMFIACDENNVPLEEPIYSITNYGASPEAFKRFEEDRLKFEQAKSRVLFENAIIIDRSPYKCTKRLLIDLAVDTPFRIYTELRYPDGNIERNEFPNQKKPNMTIEDLVEYNLTLTETAIKQIYGN
ncbi:hypothetical protein CMT57_09270 [Elizabethkingia anophelis]|nr:hypothetical protein [Elizabethkingia anophelis]MDV4010017.1 hypothetical protein [Elizabethkingia anophelis]